MSLFYRRTIQRMLDHSASFLSQKQLSEFTRDLNKKIAKEPLSREWELAVLYSFSKLGNVDHEKEMNKKKPDILWKGTVSGQTILAEIRTVSDKGLHQKNPHEFFNQELKRRVKKKGLNPGNFAIHPKGTVDWNSDKPEAKLDYPEKKNADALFESNFEEFLNYIKRFAPSKYSMRFFGEDFDVIVTYNSRNSNNSAGHIAYTVYYSIENNTIFNALEEKKDQLKKTKFQGPLGIILTDGGCRTLNGKFPDPMRRAFSHEDVIKNFLNKNHSISFVMVVVIQRETNRYGQKSLLRIKSEIFINSDADFEISEEVELELNRVSELIPAPKLDAWNAANYMRNGYNDPLKGWYMPPEIIDDDKEFVFKMSSRALLDLFSGKIALEKFVEMHTGSENGHNVFNHLKAKGFVISNVSFERSNDEDDDTFKVVMSKDVSANPFQVPKAKIIGIDR